MEGDVLGRKKQRVRYELDSGEIKSLTKDEIKAILRGADELVATGKIYPGQTPSGRFWRLARRNLPSILLNRCFTLGLIINSKRLKTFI